jgi:hypothetical protein
MVLLGWIPHSPAYVLNFLGEAFYSYIAFPLAYSLGFTKMLLENQPPYPPILSKGIQIYPLFLIFIVMWLSFTISWISYGLMGVLIGYVIERVKRKNV